MKGLIITGTLLLVVPLAVLWYTRRKRGLVNDLMDEQPVVRRKKETIVGEMEILSSDVRFVIGRKGCVVRDIESRCNVKVIFNKEEGDFRSEDMREKEGQRQIIMIRGYSLDQINDAKELIKEACELKPLILTEVITIRSEFCGKIIGKGGDNLRDIIEKSGTRILISRDGEEDHRECEIVGTRDEIDFAKSLIESNIECEMEIREMRRQRDVVRDYTGYKKEIADPLVEPADIIPTEDKIEKASFSEIFDSQHKAEYAALRATFEEETVPLIQSEAVATVSQEPVSSITPHTGLSPSEIFDLAHLKQEEAAALQSTFDELNLKSLNIGFETESLEEASPITHDDQLHPVVQEILVTTEEEDQLDAGIAQEIEELEGQLEHLKHDETAALRSTLRESLNMFKTSREKSGQEERLMNTAAAQEILGLLSGGTSIESLVTESSQCTEEFTPAHEELKRSISLDKTCDLKNLLGINSCSPKSKVVPIDVEIMNILNDAVSEAVRDAERRDGCEFVECTDQPMALALLCSAKISCIPCTSHVWLQRIDLAPVLKELLLTDMTLARAEDLDTGSKYLFYNGTVNCVRVVVTKLLPNDLVDCYDIDTGCPFTTTPTSLYCLPKTVSLDTYPALAQCVCIGDGCGKPDVTPAGSIVTVTTMGQHKDMGYPRVKLHDANGEQIVYLGDTRYTESYQIGHVSLPPSSSSLVYVSAIHNAGHFYVQVCGKNISELDRLESLMATDYGAEAEKPCTGWDPVPGDLCGVWHTAEKMWLRGQVMELDCSDMLYVKYLDYGDTVHVSHSYVRQLKPKFTTLPYQAIECFLANTVPITTRQWTPDATAKFDVLTRCGQWYPLRCTVVGEHRGQPCVELYDQPYSDKEYSVGESLCAMHYARSSKLAQPPVKTLTTPIPSFASGAAYLVSPDFEDVDDELEQLFSVDDDSDSADSDDFPVSRVNVSRLLMSLTQQNQAMYCNKTSSKYRPCDTEPKTAFMEQGLPDKEGEQSDESTPRPARKMTGVKRKTKRESEFKSQISSSSEESEILSEAADYSTPLCTSPRSTRSNSSYASTSDFATPRGDFNNTFTQNGAYTMNLATPLHLSSAEDTDCG